MDNVLRSQLLNSLVDPKTGMPALIVSLGDVTRFGVKDPDKERDIPLGQTVPFVAQMDFTLTSDGARQLAKAMGRDKPLPTKQPLLSIGDDAELATPLPLGLDDDVADWLAQHFVFTFNVQGVDVTPFRPVRRQRVEGNQYKTIYPWLQEVNTLAVAGELLEIEVDVEPRKQPARRLIRAVLTNHPAQAKFAEGEVYMRFDVAGDYECAENLVGKKYWLDLRSDTDPDLRVEVQFTKVE